MADIFDQIHATQGGAPAPGGDVFDQIHAQANTAPQQPQGSAVGRFAQGVWDTINPAPIIKKVAETELDRNNPLPLGFSSAGKAARALYRGAADQGAKAVDAYKRGENVEAFGHGLAAIIPGIGPAAANAGEKIGGTAPTYDKYGNVVDPGKAPDIAGGLGQATGLLAPFAAKPVLGAARGALANSPLPNALRASAETQYGRVLNATTKGNKLRSARVVPGLIDRGVTALTAKGLGAKAATQLESAGQALGDAYENLPDTASVPLKPLQDSLMRSGEEAFTATSPGGEIIPMSETAKAGVAHVDGLSKKLAEFATPDPQTGQLSIPVATARRLRQYYDEVAKQSGRYDGKALADQSAAAAHGMAADAIRSELANQFPDIAALNKEYSFWSDVNRVVSDTLIRRQGQAKPLGRKLASAAGTGAGFVTGGVHGAVLGRAAMDAVEAVTNSPAWQTYSAVLKDRLADAIASGSTPQVIAVTDGMMRGATAAPRPPVQQQVSAPPLPDPLQIRRAQ